MSTTPRSVMWPLVMIGAGGLWLLTVAGAFPPAVEDVLRRAWPALLILFGYDALFGRRRLRLGRWHVDSSLVGLALTLALVGGAVGMAYRQQADVVRADNVQTFSKLLPEAVQSVTLRIDLARTAVSVRPAGEENPRELALRFAGSRESDVTIRWALEGENGVLTLTESYRHSIPKLEDYGRGTLEIVLPRGVAVDGLDLRVQSGDVTLDAQALDVPRLTLAVDAGDVVLALPTEDVLDGELHVGGNLELRVPVGRALNLSAKGNSVPKFRFDRDRYDLLVGGELKNKATTEFHYTVDVYMPADATLTIVDVAS